jgi:hypothetical protein
VPARPPLRPRPATRLDAADQLTITGPNTDATQMSLYEMLLCDADTPPPKPATRARSTELLDAAETAASRLGGDRTAHWTAFGPTNVAPALGHRSEGLPGGRRRCVGAPTDRCEDARYLLDRPQPGNSSVARPGMAYRPRRIDDPGGVVAGPGGVGGPLIGTRPPLQG